MKLAFPFLSNERGVKYPASRKKAAMKYDWYIF
jgi:hypothetical protein